MLLIDFKIVYLSQVFVLLTLLYFGRRFLKKRIVSLFSNIKMPPFYLQGFRLLLGVLVLERLHESFYGRIFLIRPISFLRSDMIFELFFHSEYRFLILIVIPIIFVALFVFEWKPRFTSAIVFLYSVIGGTIIFTMAGGKISHSFHMTTLLLLGFVFYYWFYYKRNAKRPTEWMILPILLFFIATIYGSSFISKTSHLSEVPKWFTGEAVQSSIITGHYQRVLTYGYEIDALRRSSQMVINNKPIAALLGIGALLTEFSSLLLLVISSRLRFLILIGLVLFNVGSGLLILPSYFSRNILVLMYIIIWAGYTVFPNLWFDKRRKT